MGFFSGRLTSLRFKVSGRGSRTFGPEHLEKLAAHAIGKQRVASADGTSVGWIAADHILDTSFDLAKNVINDTLHFALRIDAQAIPNDLLRAYTQVELTGLAQANPSGRPSGAKKGRPAYSPRSVWKPKRPTAAFCVAKPFRSSGTPPHMNSWSAPRRLRLSIVFTRSSNRHSITV